MQRNVFKLSTQYKKSWNYFDFQKWIIEGSPIIKTVKTLNLSYKNLYAIPSQITKLPNLENLKVSNSNLTELPKQLESLSNLKTVNCSMNNIKELPNFIYNFEEFNCNMNDIYTLPKKNNIEPKIKKLDCSWNNITKLPEEFHKFTNLKYLDCSYNEFYNLFNLHYLNLNFLNCSFNKIKYTELLYLTKYLWFHNKNNKQITDMLRTNFKDCLKSYLKLDTIDKLRLEIPENIKTFEDVEKLEINFY